MAKSLDITRLADVRKRVPSMHSHKQSSRPQHATTRNLDSTIMATLSSWKKGDYELYKERQEQRQLHDDSSTCTSVSADTSSSMSDNSPVACCPTTILLQLEVNERSSSMSDNSPVACCPTTIQLQQLEVNERLIQEYRQRLSRQEHTVDSLYAKLSKTRVNIATLQHTQKDIILRAMSTNTFPSSITTTSSSSMVFKLGMLFGLLVHWYGGTPHCLALAVFGWWLTERD
jgi:hypothetical protein